MSTNPYAPPKAAVDDVAPAGAAAEPVFFPVSRTKLIVMSTLTLTLYQLVWFYHNWRLIRNRGEPVLPIMRTIFAVFFCYTLFDRIRRPPARSRESSASRRGCSHWAGSWFTVGSNVARPADRAADRRVERGVDSRDVRGSRVGASFCSRCKTPSTRSIVPRCLTTIRTTVSRCGTGSGWSIGGLFLGLAALRYVGADTVTRGMAAAAQNELLVRSSGFR